MLRTPPRLAAAAVAVALLGLLCACGVEPSEGPDPVRAVVLPYMSMTPLHIAAGEGYFEDWDLEVEFVNLRRHHELMTALARGEVDVAGGWLTTSDLALAARGELVRVVAGLGEVGGDNCAFMAFVARTELVASGALEDPEQLAALTYDIDLLSPLGYWMDRMLSLHGLRVDDVEISNLPSQAAGAALLSGSIDATIDGEPFVSRLIAEEEASLWAPVGDVVPEAPVAVLFYGPNLIEERRDVGVRFLAALQQGLARYNEGKTARNTEIVSSFLDLPQAQVNDTCWPRAPSDGSISPAAFRAYQEWNLERGLVERILDDDELFDLSFIDDARALQAR